MIIASIALMIYNISELDFNNIQKGPFAGIVSIFFLILAMLVTIRNKKKITTSNKSIYKLPQLKIIQICSV